MHYLAIPIGILEQSRVTPWRLQPWGALLFLDW